MASRTSEMLADHLRQYVAPLLGHIGFEEGPYPERLTVGIVARAFKRPLDEHRTLYATFWCDGGTGDNVRWRLDVREGTGWRDLGITFPFERPGYPPARPLGGTHTCLSEFQPARGPRNLERALQFLGPLLVTIHEQIADQVPELRADIRAALATDAWQVALQAAPGLWAARFVQGDVDATRERRLTPGDEPFPTPVAGGVASATRQPMKPDSLLVIVWWLWLVPALMVLLLPVQWFFALLTRGLDSVLSSGIGGDAPLALTALSMIFGSPALVVLSVLYGFLFWRHRERGLTLSTRFWIPLYGAALLVVMLAVMLMIARSRGPR